MYRFTIRPRHLEGECLTGYFMRLGLENSMESHTIYRYATEGFKSVLKENRKLHQIDNIPENYLNINRLSELTQINVNDLRSMTFTPVYLKLFDNINFKDRKYIQILSQSTEVNHRRFCPECLMVYKGYKLIWQVKDIEICDKHSTRLTKTCPKCGKEQPYMGNSLVEFKCFDCGTNLYEQKSVSELIPPDKKQEKLYEAWSYLLNPSYNGVKTIGNLSKEKSLAIILLYLAQSCQTTLNTKNIKHFSESITYGLLHFINDKENYKFVTVNRLLNFIWKANLDIKEVLSMDVPFEYMESVRNFYVNNAVATRNAINAANKRSVNIDSMNNSIIKRIVEKEEVINKVNEYFELKRSSTNRQLFKDVCTYIGILPATLNKHSELAIWLRNRLKEYEIERLDRFMTLIENTVIELLYNRESITYDTIANRLNIHVMVIKRNKKYIERIHNTKRLLGIL